MREGSQAGKLLRERRKVWKDLSLGDINTLVQKPQAALKCATPGGIFQLDYSHDD